MTADDGVAGFVSRIGFGCNKNRSTQGGAIIGLPQLDGAVLAHEIGHALGLRHVTNDENVMNAHRKLRHGVGLRGVPGVGDARALLHATWMWMREVMTGLQQPFSRIRAAALGEDASVPRARAIADLAASGYPNRQRDLESIVLNADEPSELRALAADWLGRIDHPSTATRVLRHLDTPDALVRQRIVHRLGLVGDERAIEPLLALSARERGPARNRARFAAALIAHRYRHESSPIELPPSPASGEFPPGQLMPIVAIPPPRQDVEACLLDVADSSIGISFGEASALQVRIDANRWMVLLDAAFEDTGELACLEQQCAVLGGVAEWHAQSRQHFLTGLILSSPDRSSVPRLHLHDLDGVLLGLGDSPAPRNWYSFTLRTVADAIGIAFELKGTLRDGRLSLSSSRGAEVFTRRRIPAPLPLAASSRCGSSTTQVRLRVRKNIVDIDGHQGHRRTRRLVGSGTGAVIRRRLLGRVLRVRDSADCSPIAIARHSEARGLTRRFGP